MVKFNKIIILFSILYFSIILVGCNIEEVNSASLTTPIQSNNNNIENPTFTSSEIPEDIKIKMLGKSMPSDEPIYFESLSYLKLSYYGFDDKTHVGELIVNKKIDLEVVDIFKELYENKYPIEKMKLIDEYDAIDDNSMKDNNTSSFYYRTVANTNVISNHGKGVAIDINPLFNPHVNISKNTVSPDTAYKYTDRKNIVKGMITKGDACYNAFIKRGWSWGGDWKNPDYQHFEKNI